MKETGPKNGIPLETLFKSATKDGILLITLSVSAIDMLR